MITDVGRPADNITVFRKAYKAAALYELWTILGYLLSYLRATE